MLVHSITRYEPPPKKKEKVRVGGEEHKQFIYWRLINTMAESGEFEEGCEYYVKGTGNSIIINVGDFEQCEWDGLKCKCIELWVVGTDRFIMAHPGDLQRVRN